MSLYSIFDWRVITYLIPFLGLIIGAYLLISHKICTKRIAVSTAISLSLMLWLLLTWADWGSEHFVASYQIMWVRIILLIITGLITYELRAQRKYIKALRVKNNRLNNQNQALIKNLSEFKERVEALKVINKE